MIHLVEVKEGVLLKDYDLYSTLAMPLRELNTEASALVPKIKHRKIWMVNSTAQGGGVAEMMPRTVSFLRQLGLDCEWIVASSEQKDFFNLTKRIHNLIHGEGVPTFSFEDKQIYEEVNRQNAEELIALIKPEDFLVIHDPQPAALGYFIKQKMDIQIIWRCHIGLDQRIPQTTAAWNFLKPYLEVYDKSIFSAHEYIPSYLNKKSIVMYPAIDPLDHKNRDLPIHKVVGILCNSNLVPEYHPVLTPQFPECIKKLQRDGSFQSPLFPSDPGLLFKPMVLQVSRWDKLKGFLPLMKGFTELKNNKDKYSIDDRNLRRLNLVELVLAGPDPDYLEDDPEGKGELKELCNYFLTLPCSIQNQISILKLPMSSRKNNELMVNAMQRISTVVVQNSLHEGFGLTVTEAMWKVKPVIGTSARGIRQQIRDNIDGLIIENPNDLEEIAIKLNFALSSPKEREVWGYNAQKTVIENFLIFTQIGNWIKLFASI